MELQQDVVEEKTFGLLKSLMSEDFFSEFFLVGGTALALRLGHRKSIDIDMFTQGKIPVNDVRKHLSEKYGFREEFREKDTLKGDIDGVKVDFIRYDYPLLNSPETFDGNIRIASNEDIIAMKLATITDSGSRAKDFVDIAFLSKYYSLNQMLDFYKAKFDGVNIFSATKALVYFTDIDFSSEPVNLMHGKFEWAKVEARLIDMVRNPEKKYEQLK